MRFSHGKFSLGLMLASLLVVNEMVSYILVTQTQLAQQVYYSPNILNEDEYAWYLLARDLDTGWPSRPKEFLEKGFFPRAGYVKGPTCLSVYGDSFTYGEGVSTSESWPEVLAAKRRCHVLNYGMGSYGTDQMLLRYDLNRTFDKSPIVLLNNLSVDIQRVGTQYDDLITPPSPMGFKPTYRLVDKNLVLYPLPKFSSYSAYLKAVIQPSLDTLPGERYLPSSTGRATGYHFPMSWLLLKGFMEEFSHPRATHYMQEYSPSSELQRTTIAIFKRFMELAKANGQVGIIGLFPTCLDFRFYRRNGRFPYQSLADELASANIPYIDVGSEFVKLNKAESAEQLYLACDDHWNPAGNNVVAGIIDDALQRKGFDLK